MTDSTGNNAAVASPRDTVPLFEAREISKSFGEVAANRNISLSVNAGEILALLGENGAGKSTFVKMIDGVLKPDIGAFFWNGKQVSISSPAIARRIGIGMVFQHFSSFEALTVLENLALALPRKSKRAIRRDVKEISERYGLSINPNIRVERLSAGEKQRIEIVRALLQKPKLLILDEPTSVLTPQEADGLFKTLDTLAADGVAIIYISHRLSEIKELCDRATVLRQGEVVGSCDPQTASVSQIAEMMIGKTADPIRRIDAYVGGPRLVVENLSVRVPEGVSLKNVSFTARRGEIMGIAGIAGEGQDALFAALSGERRTPAVRSIKMNDKSIGGLGPTARRRLGAAFAPEQRLGHASIADMTLSENLRLTRHGLRGQSRRMLRARSAKIREAYDVRAAPNDPKAGTLSGGNLQKFVIGRELDREPDVFVVAQPTWGVDAGAASFIRNELLAVTQRGGTVVVISQDLDEIFQIADRVAVLHRGELSKTHLVDDMTPEKIGLLMAGETPILGNTGSVEKQPARTRTRAAVTTTAAATAATSAAITAAMKTAPAGAFALPSPSPQPVSTAIQPQRISTQEVLKPEGQTNDVFPVPLSASVSGSLTVTWTPPEQFQKGGLRP